MKKLLLIISLVLVSGCFGSSEEQKTAESVAKKQDAEIRMRKHEGMHEMYAELNDKDRRWVESGFRQTHSVSDKDKDQAYVLLTEKMAQGSWVFKLAPIICDECNGTGFVSYDENHFFVVNDLAEANVKYTCSMCQGTGGLLREERTKNEAK
jgi:hypothetical protein